MTKGHKETHGGDGSVGHLGCAGGFVSAHVYQKASKCTLGHVPVMVRLSLLHFNKAVE